MLMPNTHYVNLNILLKDRLQFTRLEKNRKIKNNLDEEWLEVNPDANILLRPCAPTKGKTGHDDVIY